MIEAKTLPELIDARAAESPDALLAVDERDRRLSFSEYRDASLRCASGLQAMGIGQHTRVSWMLPTRLESLVLVGALSRLAATQNPILPSYREREVGFITRQFKPRLLIVPGVWRGFDYPGMARDVARDAANVGVLVVDGDDALPDAEPESLTPVARDAQDTDPLRWVFYTSGTTADPKGVLHTDGTLMVSSRGMSRALALEPDDRVAMVFPFTHIGGIGWLFGALLTGCSQIVVEAFDPDTTIPILSRHGVTQATAGTVFHQAYLAAQRSHGAAPLFPRLRACPGGGAPKPPQLHYEIKKEMGGAGIVSGYGMTECPISFMNSVGDSDDKLAHTEGSASPPELEVRVVKPAASSSAASSSAASSSDLVGSAPPGSELAKRGEQGEFRLRGPQLFKGYVDASLNADAFDEEGFFRTGDLGTLDADGYAVVTGRLKDVIIRKGENISAQEVEDLLYRHPGVAEVAVVGLPDAERGELCCAVIVSDPVSAAPDFDEMVAFLRAQGLMIQKIPERLETIRELPRNPTGKVLKQELRARYS